MSRPTKQRGHRLGSLVGPEGFTGGMNARNCIALTGSSKATATRDLQQLARLGARAPLSGGLSTRYELPETCRRG